ncbi:MAG: [protein-PII] uridylyltransferase [Candidatus Latescibacterota bacterium]
MSGPEPQALAGSGVQTAWLRQAWEAERAAAQAAHRGGEAGLDTARRLAEAVEGVVLRAYATASQGDSGRHALVAVGGFGRREMAPCSDVDLLFLFAGEADRDPRLIAGVLHPLWDLRFDVGHGSRTVAEAVALARDDMESCTAMMDSRFLAGDRPLYDAFVARFYRRLPRDLVGKLHQWRASRVRRGASVQLLEPNLKESPGGLRDIQVLEWALKVRAGQPDAAALWPTCLAAEDVQALAEGRSFLWRVRHALHFSTGRKRDVLEHDLKPGIAHGLGYQDRGQELAVESFMHDYYLHARAVHHLVELAFRRLAGAGGARRSLGLEPGVLAVDGEIVLSRGAAHFAEDPVCLLRLFEVAQARGLVLSEETQRTVRASLPLIDDGVRSSPQARDVLLRITGRREGVAATLRAMHDLGVLGAYLPEFGAATCLVQYDIYHIYTVDEHTLVAIDNLESLAAAGPESRLRQVLEECPRRDLLYLAVLLHDVGKSRRQDHITCGVEMARGLAARVGLEESEAEMLVFLVRHHQEMVILSQRRDLDDYRLIAGFAARFPSMEWLRALYLLSYADLSAVSPDAWSEWQDALLFELYHKTAEQLESGIKTLEERQVGRRRLDEHLRAVAGRWPPARVLAFQEHVEQLPPRYLAAYEREEIEHHLHLVEGLTPERLYVAEFVARPAYCEVLICTRDQRQLLAKICGALAVNDLNILRADVNTRDDEVVLDIFQVTDVDGSPSLPEWKQERVRARLEEVIALRRKASELLSRYSVHWERRKRHRRPLVRPPHVEVENQASDRYTVIDVECEDDVGLLYRITHCLSELGLDIHMAIVNTVASRARDAFYVVDEGGEKIVNYQVLEEIRQALLARLGE